MKPYRYLEEADQEFQEHIGYFDNISRTVARKFVDETVGSTLRFHPAQSLVGRQFQFGELLIGEASDAIGEARLRDGSHLKRQGDGGVRKTALGGVDHGGSGEPRTIEIRRQRNHEHGVKRVRERVTLPEDDRAPPGLLARSVVAEIRPPDFAALHPPSS